MNKMPKRSRIYHSALLILSICRTHFAGGTYFEEYENIGEKTPDDFDYSADYNFQPLIIEGDILVDPMRNAMSNDFNRWPNGTLPYTLDARYSNTQKKIIYDAMREIERNVNSANGDKCIKFVKRNNEKSYLRIHTNQNLCNSYVGYQPTLVNGQDVTLGKDCMYNGVIIHELIHSLGFYHEHSRPDRDKYVDIDFHNVDKNDTSAFKLRLTSRTFNTNYDFGSVMHYDAYAFAVDKRRPVLTPKPGQVVKGRMGQSWRMSQNDVLKIQRFYRCKEETTHIRVPEMTSSDQCDFRTSMCGFINDPKADFEWTLQSTPSETGPYADSSTGTGNYLIAKARDHRKLTARLISPREYTNRKLCVAFYLYHGQATGVTRIVLRSSSKSYDKKVRSYYSLKKPYWVPINVEVTRPYSWKSYRIMLEAYTDVTDIAIDDLRFYEGNCYGI